MLIFVATIILHCIGVYLIINTLQDVYILIPLDWKHVYVKFCFAFGILVFSKWSFECQKWYLE